MTYLQSECSHRRAGSVRRFNVGRVFALNNPPAVVVGAWQALHELGHRAVVPQPAPKAFAAAVQFTRAVVARLALHKAVFARPRQPVR